MGIPKRVKGFRDRAVEDNEQLQKDYEESYDTRDDRGFALGSFFDLELIKQLGVEIWRPDVGEHYLDVIPFYAGRQHPAKAEGQLTYKVDFWGHQRIGPMNEFFVCKANTWKRPDPICTWMKQNYIEDKKQYSAIKPSRRCAYLVWVHDNAEMEKKGIMIFEVSHFFFEKKVAEIAKKPRGGGFIDWTHYDVGKHVYWNINKTGSYEDASGTKRDSIEYTGFQLIERDTPKIPDYILEQSFALDEVIKMNPTDEEIKIAFFGSAKEPEVKTETASSRLPKKTALERAREKAESQETGPPPEDDLREGPHDGLGPAEVAQEPEEQTPEPEEQTPEPEQKKTPAKKATPAPSGEHICPASEIGGQFGVTIEQLDECDDCNIWEACSDENSRLSKGGSSNEPAVVSSEQSKGSKLVRR